MCLGVEEEQRREGRGRQEGREGGREVEKEKEGGEKTDFLWQVGGL